MSGSPQALADMIANMSHGGKIAILGIPATPGPLDMRAIIFNMLTLKGIYGREMYETWYKMSVMLESGVDIKPIITHRFSYADYEQGFAAMMSGNTGKVVLDWTSLIA
jgi:threonine 3-dehydrogenase